MFVEDLEQLPEVMRDQFVETEVDGKKGFQDKDSLELKQHLFNVKEENKKIKSGRSELEEKLNEIKAQESEKIEQAKREALEKAKKDGKSDEAVTLLQQELEDLRQRSNETETQYKKRIEDMTTSISTEKSNAVASDIVGEVGNTKGAKYLKKIILERTKVDAETGKITFLDENGGATSLDKQGFIAELKKDEDIHPLLKSDVVTNGGGFANGQQGRQNGGGATNQAANEAKSKGDLNAYLAASLNYKP